MLYHTCKTPFAFLYHMQRERFLFHRSQSLLHTRKQHNVGAGLHHLSTLQLQLVSKEYRLLDLDRVAMPCLGRRMVEC